MGGAGPRHPGNWCSAQGAVRVGTRGSLGRCNSGPPGERKGVFLGYSPGRISWRKGIGTVAARLTMVPKLSQKWAVRRGRYRKTEVSIYLQQEHFQEILLSVGRPEHGPHKVGDK